jgi:hypothetical protein
MTLTLGFSSMLLWHVPAGLRVGSDAQSVRVKKHYSTRLYNTHTNLRSLTINKYKKRVLCMNRIIITSVISHFHSNAQLIWSV